MTDRTGLYIIVLLTLMKSCDIHRGVNKIQEKMKSLETKVDGFQLKEEISFGKTNKFYTINGQKAYTEKQF